MSSMNCAKKMAGPCIVFMTLFSRKLDHSSIFSQIFPLMEDATTASIKAIPLKPSSMLGYLGLRSFVGSSLYCLKSYEKYLYILAKASI